MKRFFIFFLLISFNSHGYVLTKSTLGQTIKWNAITHTVSLNSNLFGNDSQLLANAVAQWNGKSKMTISVKVSKGSNYRYWVGNGSNDIGYSQDATYFSASCAVLGVTTLSYGKDGSIAEADILLNGYAGCFSSYSTDSNFLGNVITHELGHFIGLAHSETVHSTMYYQASVGQYVISTDEQAGIYDLYPIIPTTSVKGKIIAGNSLNPILGAHVLLISIHTGEVIASALSDPDGTFSISGISIKKNNRYYIYVTPLKNKNVLPTYYYNIRNDFCYSHSSYRGSFYQSCGSSMNGYPLGFKVSSDGQTIDMGDITIRCNLDVPDSYLSFKPSSINEIDIIDSNDNIGKAFVGFFNKQFNYENNILSSVELSGEDQFRLDLSQYDFSSMVESDESIYLEYRFITQDIFSKLVAKVSINGIEQNVIYTDTDNTTKLVQYGRVQVSKTNFNYNDFSFKITPLNKWGKCSDSLTLSMNQMCPINGYSEKNIFPMDTDNYDSQYIYFMDFHISKKSNLLLDIPENYQIISTQEYEAYLGNNSCPDGPEAYSISAYIPEALGGLTRNRKSDGDPIACGEVDISNPRGPSGNSAIMVLGFLLIMVVSQLKRLREFN